MATIGNIDASIDEGTHTGAAEKRRLFFLNIAYYPNGQIASVQVSVGGAVVLLIALLARWVPWGEFIHLITKLP